MSEESDHREEFGIWPPYEVFYLESILVITHVAMSAQTDFQLIVEERKKGNFDHDYELLESLSIVVTQAAALSRYFWPVGANPIFQKRGKKLREAFGIDETNPLKDRKGRNSIEHFDEKLDLYFTTNVVGVIQPSFVGPKNRETQNITHYFRAYFTDTRTFNILGVEFEIYPVIKEIIRIHLLLEKAVKEGGRLPGEPIADNETKRNI